MADCHDLSQRSSRVVSRIYSVPTVSRSWICRPFEMMYPPYASGPARLTLADANETQLSVRSTPDLRLVDRTVNSFIDVEVKSTTQTDLSRWRYPKDSIHRLQKYHPSAILLLYSVRSHAFAAAHIQNIQWQDHPTYPESIQTDVRDWLDVWDVFSNIDRESYMEFMLASLRILKYFGSSEKPAVFPRNSRPD